MAFNNAVSLQFTKSMRQNSLGNSQKPLLHLIETQGLPAERRNYKNAPLV